MFPALRPILPLLPLTLFCLSLSVGSVQGGPKVTSYWQVDDLRAGMKGIGRTVMKGTKIDRFQAEVASNIDVVQAQESVAGATESYIASLYDHNVAKAAMARALGLAEATYKQLLRGE